jgi:hypothetical protein
MNRRDFIQTPGLATAGLVVPGWLYAGKNGFPVVPTSLAQRKFASTAVENLIVGFQSSTSNKELAWLFVICFPSTSDTTVDFEMVDGKPDPM